MDDLANTVTKMDTEGNRLMILAPDGVVLRTVDEIGAVVGKVLPCAGRHSGRMFNRPTDACVCPRTSKVFVSDGYGNSAVHRFGSDGSHELSWGSPGPCTPMCCSVRVGSCCCWWSQFCPASGAAPAAAPACV